MFQLASIKHQSSIVFLAVALVSILCLVQSVKAQDELEDEADLGIEPIDEEDVALEQPTRSCRYNCFRPYSPLCGSDRKTYGNMCHLNTKNRLDGTRVRRVSSGTCQRCNRVPPPVVTCVCENCPLNRVRCFRTSNPNRPVTCNNVDRPVCGTNGVTYRNACQLARATACLGYPVRVCRNGRCSPRNNEDEAAGIVEMDEKNTHTLFEEAETLETFPQIQF